MKNVFFKPYFLMAILFLSITSCNNDDNPVPDPGTTESTAILTSLRVSTPGGNVYYMGAYADIPDEMDYRDMVELGTASTVSSYKEHPYVWNGNSSILTKYEVTNELEIKVSDVVSFASTGISGGFGLPAFVSDEQAFFFALAEGKVIEFNPTTMKITETINVPVLDKSDNSEINTHTYSNIITPNGKVILPIGSYPSDNPDTFPQYGEIAVFDPSTNILTYVKDTRMSMGYDTAVKGNDGSYYYRPSKNTAAAEDYTSLTDYPTQGGLLKIKEDGTFDSDYFVDLNEILGSHSTNSVVYVYDNKAIVQYLDGTFTPPNDINEWWSATTKFALVDLINKTFEPFTSFEQYGTVFTIGQIDGVEYYGNFGATSGKFSLLKQTSATNFEVVSEPISRIAFISRLR